MTERIFAVEEVIEDLAWEGHARDEVMAAIDSLIDAGLDVEQPDEDSPDAGVVLTEREVDLIRDQIPPHASKALA